QIETNIITGGQEQIDTFSLIDRVRIIRETRDGRMMDVEVTLSDWVFNAIRANEVLTLNRDYFRLRKPLERRLYELARKHCGTKDIWKIGLELLQKKCGSNSTLFEFRRLVKTIADADGKHQHMPDYAVSLTADDFVTFESRGSVPGRRTNGGGVALLDHGDYEAARAAAPGWDVYQIECEWRSWCADKKAAPKRPGAHFVRFCKSWFEKRGRP
ncbi:plasmid replication initiator RepA, partial [Amaricoccus sp. HAR-UPW-R2A-40]